MNLFFFFFLFSFFFFSFFLSFQFFSILFPSENLEKKKGLVQVKATFEQD